MPERLPRCSVCGNDYDKAFEIVRGGERRVFDCFECAIHAMAPRCSHCGCTIIGHGSEAKGKFFCCAHCAEQQNVPEITDRVG
jgi:Rieske Fe-S protein